MGMIMEFVKSLIDGDGAMSESDRELMKWAEAVSASNWVMLYRLRMEQELNASEFFDKLAIAYAHCYAAGQEPKRDADWTAFKKVLENLHYPEYADAVKYRHDNKTG